MQTILLIFIAIFSLAIGFFLGMFLLSLDTPITKIFSKKDDSPGEEALPSADQDPSMGIPTPADTAQKPSPDSRLLLRIWKEEGKPPVYDLDGTFLEKEDLPREVLNVITVPQDTPQAPPRVPTTPPPVVEEIPDIAPPEDDGELEAKMLSVIDEVNDILQKKLAGSPLAGKGIHLMENHNREIRFWVGLISYDDVDDIPDQEVRQIIDASVKEWEQNRG